MAGPPTSRDVAVAAGVSQSTVSYVMSGKRPVAPETEQRVRAAMEDLGYRPHARAQALRNHRSGTIGLIVPYHDNTDAPSQYRYVVSIAAACRRQGYELLVITAAEGTEGMRRLVGSALCDGILVMDVLEEDPRVEVANEGRIPSVFIGLSTDTPTVTSIDTDFEAIGRGCVNHLATAGHTAAAVVRAASDHVTPLGFMHRFNRALTSEADARGVALTDVPVVRDYRRTREALLSSPGFADQDAFVVAPACSADDTVNALLSVGRTIGVDTSVIAAGGSGDSSHTVVDYTYYDSDVRTVTHTAVSLLVDLLRHPVQSAGSRPSLIPPLLHAGESIRPAPPAKEPPASRSAP